MHLFRIWLEMFSSAGWNNQCSAPLVTGVSLSYVPFALYIMWVLALTGCSLKSSYACRCIELLWTITKTLDVKRRHLHTDLISGLGSWTLRYPKSVQSLLSAGESVPVERHQSRSLLTRTSGPPADSETWQTLSPNLRQALHEWFEARCNTHAVRHVCQLPPTTH